MTEWVKQEIEEFPFHGTIYSVIQGHGDEDDSEIIIYDGMMDSHMRFDEEGDVMQTSSYIVSIPLIKNDMQEYIIPKKGDKIQINEYGFVYSLTVDNSTPSQIGGVSIYATRNSW